MAKMEIKSRFSLYCGPCVPKNAFDLSGTNSTIVALFTNDLNALPLAMQQRSAKI